MSNDLLKKLAV